MSIRMWTKPEFGAVRWNKMNPRERAYWRGVFKGDPHIGELDAQRTPGGLAIDRCWADVQSRFDDLPEDPTPDQVRDWERFHQSVFAAKPKSCGFWYRLKWFILHPLSFFLSP
jgi:hypothetical protein